MTLKRVTGGSRVLSVFPRFEVTMTTADLQGSRFKLKHAQQQTLNKLRTLKRKNISVVVASSCCQWGQTSRRSAGKEKRPQTSASERSHLLPSEKSCFGIFRTGMTTSCHDSQYLKNKYVGNDFLFRSAVKEVMMGEQRSRSSSGNKNDNDEIWLWLKPATSVKLHYYRKERWKHSEWCVQMQF